MTAHRSKSPRNGPRSSSRKTARAGTRPAWRTAAIPICLAFAASCSGQQGPPHSAIQPPQVVDLIIRGGTLVDGSGNEPYVGDVAIAGERVVPSDSSPITQRARRSTPGYGGRAGLHQYAFGRRGMRCCTDGRGLSDIKQGVTLEVLGEGDSMGPLNDASRAEIVRSQSDFHYDVDWTTLGEGLDRLAAHGVSPNVALLCRGSHRTCSRARLRKSRTNTRGTRANAGPRPTSHARRRSRIE